jgi:hypothetical protein
MVLENSILFDRYIVFRNTFVWKYIFGNNTTVWPFKAVSIMVFGRKKA